MGVAFADTGTAPKTKGPGFTAIRTESVVDDEAVAASGTVPISAAKAPIRQAKRIRAVQFMCKLAMVW